MAARKVLRIGNPELREISKPIPESEIRSKEIKKLIRDMTDTMEAQSGVGLAAPQIGVLKRIFIVSRESEDSKTSTIHAFINPEIKILNGPVKGFWEGCLSIPGMRGLVERSRRIQMKWFDEHENQHDQIIEGFEAVVMQHEFDHLNGIIYIDRLKDSKLFGFNEELDALDDD
jgi:peptide deformylase